MAYQNAHYKAAEDLLRRAEAALTDVQKAANDGYALPSHFAAVVDAADRRVRVDAADRMVRMAQVHATLATVPDTVTRY